jgi:hypothetical protein
VDIQVESPSGEVEIHAIELIQELIEVTFAGSLLKNSDWS